MLSNRGIHYDNYSYFQRRYVTSYLAANRKKGVIDLHRAEMKLMEDIINEKVTEAMQDLIQPDILYPVGQSPRFGKTVADFLSDYFRAKKILPEEIMALSGVGAALEFLAFCLADPGDSFLLAGPNYFKIEVDIGERCEVKTIIIPSSAQHGFQLCLSAVEKTFQDAVKKGQRVKGLILVNPTNPTGDVFSEELLMNILHFCKRNELHVIVDEIYALSVFGDGTEFDSVLSMAVPDPERTHFVWGPSKDFGLAGLRLGLLYTKNPMLARLFTRCGEHWRTSPMIMELFCRIVEDKEWMTNVFLPIHKKRLQEAHSYSKERLEAMDVPVHPSTSSVFIWANFSQYLESNSQEAELQLFLELRAEGVLISPGCTNLYCQEPGWFRVLATASHRDTVEGLSRIQAVLNRVKAKKRDG